MKLVVVEFYGNLWKLREGSVCLNSYNQMIITGLGFILSLFSFFLFARQLSALAFSKYHNRSCYVCQMSIL